MQSQEHAKHVAENVSHSRCPECRADNQRWHAQMRPFQYVHVAAYLAWIRPRLAAIRDGVDSVEARRWERDFVSALHNRLYSRMAGTGRKFAPDYAKYHLATYGNDYRFLHNL